MRFFMLGGLGLLLSLGACDRECDELTRIRPDDEAINGVAAEDLQTVLLTPDGGLPLLWNNGDETTVEASITTILGTARLSQRSDCVAECDTRFQLLMACGPDQLRVDATLKVETADGLLDEEVPATLTALRSVDGEVVWSLYAEFLLDGADSRIDPASIGEACGSGETRDEGIIVWSDGRDGAIEQVSVGHMVTLELGRDDANCTGGLGSTAP